MSSKGAKIIHSNNPLLYLLYPFALLFRMIVYVRRWLYQRGFYSQTRFRVPVIIVGNISVGGTGKTPLVIYLTQLLRDHGYKPGIVSRGYKGKADHYPISVSETSTAKEVGDEALLLRRRCQCPVIIDPERVRAVRYLLKHFDCNVVISDDGLQHYALARDMEIAVVDGARGFGNGLCLPAGPLREPIKRLQEVDCIVLNNDTRHSMKSLINKTIINMELVPEKICNLKTDIIATVDLFVGKTVHAVAGIGNPERFFQTLRLMGLHIITHAFPDHHAFTAADLDFGPDATIIMTEKDAVKCADFAKEQHWYLSVKAKVQGDFIQLLEKTHI